MDKKNIYATFTELIFLFFRLKLCIQIFCVFIKCGVVLFFNFACGLARGFSGGLICVWNSLVFQKHKVICYDNFIVVEGVWLHSNIPTLFHFFLICGFDTEDFQKLMIDAWSTDGIDYVNSLVAFKNKLQHLKNVVRKWNSTNCILQMAEKEKLSSLITSIDILVDEGFATREDLMLINNQVRQLVVLHNHEAKDLAQRDKVK